MQSNDEITTPVCLEEFTIHVAIELSGKSWVIGVKFPGSGKGGLHTLKTSDTRGLIALIERHREDALKKTGSTVRVLCCYEAGFEGFWLARCLETNGYETIVLDPSSLLVNRKARQRKTDRIDAKKMIRALLAHDRGDSQVLSRVCRWLWKRAEFWVVLRVFWFSRSVLAIDLGHRECFRCAGLPWPGRRRGYPAEGRIVIPDRRQQGSDTKGRKQQGRFVRVDTTESPQ